MNLDLGEFRRDEPHKCHQNIFHLSSSPRELGLGNLTRTPKANSHGPIKPCSGDGRGVDPYQIAPRTCARSPGTLELTVLAVFLPLIAHGAPSGRASTSPPNGFSAFTSPNNNLAFALNLPDDGSNDLYFSLSAWSNISWAVRTPTLPRWSTLTVLGCGQRKPRYIEP